MDDRVAEVVVTAEEHEVVEVVIVEEVLEGCLAHFPDFLPSVDKVQLSTKITSDFKGEVEYSSLSTKLAVLSV